LLVLERQENLEVMFLSDMVVLEDIESIKPVEVTLEVSFIIEHLWINIIQDTSERKE
jgi:hypothetical protein